MSQYHENYGVRRFPTIPARHITATAWRRVVVGVAVTTFLALSVGPAVATALPHSRTNLRVAGTTRASATAITTTNPICPPAGCPQPDPSNATIYYGATPALGETKPVLLFVHGLGGVAEDWWTGGNDMYSMAYKAGYRTAFVSLAPGGARGPAQDSYTQGITLSQQIMTITQYFNVPYVDIVAHSKGGIDTQAAIAFDMSRSAPLVRYVTTLSSPHHGTKLADIVCALPPGTTQQFGIVQTPGLCGTPDVNQGVNQGGLTTTSMEAFRQAVDPILATVPVTFFVASGTDWQDTPSLQLPGKVLAAAEPNSSNDGFVSVSSSCLLPGAHYLFAKSVDHGGIRVGHNSFPFIALVEQGVALVNRNNAASAGSPGPAQCVLRP